MQNALGAITLECAVAYHKHRNMTVSRSGWIAMAWLVLKSFHAALVANKRQFNGAKYSVSLQWPSVLLRCIVGACVASGSLTRRALFYSEVLLLACKCTS